MGVSNIRKLLFQRNSIKYLQMSPTIYNKFLQIHQNMKIRSKLLVYFIVHTIIASNLFTENEKFPVKVRSEKQKKYSHSEMEIQTFSRNYPKTKTNRKKTSLEDQNKGNHEFGM